MEQEQECLVNKLMRKIEKLEAETLAKQTNLEQLRREKVNVLKYFLVKIVHSVLNNAKVIPF